MPPKGKPGKPRQVISDWIDVEDDYFWLTVIAVAGWMLAGWLYFNR